MRQASLREHSERYRWRRGRLTGPEQKVSPMRRIFTAALVSAVTGAVLSVAPGASAEVAAVKYVPAQIDLGNMSGSGKVIVYLEVATDLNKLGIPQKLEEFPLATIPVTRGGMQRIKLPVTKQVLANASSGLADYTFAAWFGNSRATSEASVPVASAKGNAAAAESGSNPMIMFSSYERINGQPDPVFPCRAVADGKQVEKSNLIGQIQDSASKGSQVSWDYGVSADSTFGVAVSDSPTKNYASPAASRLLSRCPAQVDSVLDLDPIASSTGISTDSDTIMSVSALRNIRRNS
jgi:hypothetical protein